MNDIKHEEICESDEVDLMIANKPETVDSKAKAWCGHKRNCRCGTTSYSEEYSANAKKHFLEGRSAALKEAAKKLTPLTTVIDGHVVMYLGDVVKELNRLREGGKE